MFRTTLQLVLMLGYSWKLMKPTSFLELFEFRAGNYRQYHDSTMFCYDTLTTDNNSIVSSSALKIIFGTGASYIQ